MNPVQLTELTAKCQRLEGPGVIRVKGLNREVAEQIKARLEGESFHVGLGDGQKMASKKDLLKVISKEFAFPVYFGDNWDALVDCWSDLAWLPAGGYGFILFNEEDFKARDQKAHQMLLEVAEDVADRWREGEGGKPFKLIVGDTAAHPVQGKNS